MGLKERLEGVQREARDKQLEAALRRSELQRALREGSELRLDELRASGVLPMVEELTGPIVLEPEKSKSTAYHSWKYIVETPTEQTGQENSRSTITIEAYRIRREGSDPSCRRIYSDSVRVSFDGMLTISGSARTYYGNNPTDDLDRENVETALFEAFSSPRVEPLGTENEYAD